MMPLDELKKYYVAPEEKESSSDEINQARARLEKLNAMRRRPVFENQDAANAIQEQSKGGLINMGNDLSISAIGGGIGNALGNTPGAILGSLAARPMVDFPAPDSPISPKISPCMSSILALSTRTSPAKFSMRNP